MNCMWCNNSWGADDRFETETYEIVNEFERTIDSSNFIFLISKGEDDKMFCIKALKGSYPEMCDV